MRVIGLFCVGSLLLAGSAMLAQEPSPRPVGTMSELMMSMTYPAANEILLIVRRGGPQDDAEWRATQRAAVLLGESGNVMMMSGRAVDRGSWIREASALVDVATAAYRAAGERDGDALIALGEPLSASCVECHKQYRPDVHPPRP
jgi:hypothetical protein